MRQWFNPATIGAPTFSSTRMSIVTILFPDFALIFLGFLLVRYADWGQAFWGGLEKLIYYYLFPALLFYTTARTQFDFASTGKMLQVALLTLLAGIALGWLGKPLFKAAPMVFESGVQTAFRFNSYLALAIASRLSGDKGTTLMALIIGFAVPICNVAAVHALARQGGGVLREVLRNPLLLATAGGMAFNLLGFTLPEIAGATLSRMANASLALGLIAVGAGLRLSGLHASKGLASWFLGVKLLAMPAIGLALGLLWQLPPPQLQIAVAFCALPTASSAYVLATRMGGNGAFVAFLISSGTALSVLTLPLWLSLAR